MQNAQSRMMCHNSKEMERVLLYMALNRTEGQLNWTADSSVCWSRGPVSWPDGLSSRMP